ncbi:MAG: DUF3300 domain-containing protein [Nitrospirota bacterium]
MKEIFRRAPVLMIILFLISLSIGVAQREASAAEQTKPLFKQEELDQMLAPIALYPDSLLAQIMMASTYPLQIVQADRFVKQQKGLKGEQLMEKAKVEEWDPSVKSLLQFPDVLALMSEKLDWTTKLGDAFLSQQKDVSASIQRLRKKAYESGNLKTTKEQKVIVEKETIVIQPSNPQVIYVPAYNPTVVYGVWAYPAYPPYPYYPPGYVAGVSAFSFAAGVAVGAAASGCCWGGWNWGAGDVDIDVNRYNNFTQNNYTGVKAEQYKANTNVQKQNWQHNAENRKGVAYRDQTTAQKYNRGTGGEAARSREAYRGRGEQAGQVGARGGAEQVRGGQRPERSESPFQMDRGGAFSGMDRGGSATRSFSERGGLSRGGGFSGGGRGGGRR